MRECIVRKGTQVTTFYDIPATVVENLDTIWSRIGFNDHQVQVNTYFFYYFCLKGCKNTIEKSKKKASKNT